VNRTNKILAVLLGVQVALAILVFLKHDDNPIGKLEPLVDGLPVDKVDRIRVFDSYPPPKQEGEDKKQASKPDQPAVELVKRGSDWQLASHHDYPADGTKVSELLDKVTAIRTRGPIASGKARQKQLEVADDDYQRKLVISAGGKDTTLFVGTSAGARQTSVRLAGSNDVHGASGLSAFAVGANAAAWIDTAYFKVEKEQIASIEVSNQNGTFTIEPAATGGGWTVEMNGKPIVIPAGSEIDKDFVDRAVSRISSMTMTEPGDPRRSVDKPQVTVVVHMKAPQAAAGPDGGPPAVSQPGQEYTVDVAESGEKDKSFVKVRGSPHAALVHSLSLSELVEMSASKLVRKHEDKPAPPPGGEGMPEGLPPGIDLEQLQQQMQQQGQPP
jgi:hypothetical protein